MTNKFKKKHTHWIILSLFIGSIFLQCRTNELVPTPNPLLAITFNDISVIATSRDSSAHVLTIKVPYLTNLKQLKPTLTLTDGATVVPRSGDVQDFSKTVFYTVTEQNGAKTVYQINVKLEKQPVPQLTALSTDTLEAGESVRLTGHHFGTFGLDIRVVLTSPTNQTTVLTTTLVDSTHAQAQLPFTVSPGRYSMQVWVRDVQSTDAIFLQVRYPSPQLKELDQHHLRAGDTLGVTGLYIQPATYQYTMLVSNESQHRQLDAIRTTTTGFSAKLDSDLPAGRYRIQLLNRSENKLSRDTSFSVQVYDRSKPFIMGITTPKASYTPGETIFLKTANFDTVIARFYQLQLTGYSRSYTVNGIYDSTKQILTLALPSTGQKGGYKMAARLLDATGQLVYSFDTDLQLVFP
ncbi:hypothetical protein [Spirosoma foliorum]|uniref:DUF5018 domain-containing protein n=1 Tax=Spirosoma foliorum TaxID=2710596 RepID=A0A7G5GWU1_9BACT|nr:hypothetical protein [Spirosoma foliorum]QMW03333.1 hypothetical protein H3H32_36695 [Spirosoma foliorum]